MKKFTIVTDSASDLNKKWRDENGIAYAKMMMSWTQKDGTTREEYCSLDWDKISVKDFYDLERDGVRVFTAQVTMQNYLDVFLPILEKGEDVLYIACSSGLSASLHLAEMLANEELKEKFPNNKVVVFDTLRAGMSEGQIVMRAVELQKEGKSLEEIIDILEKEKRSYKEIGIPESLTYLRRAGRVSASAAYFGNIVSLKPILMWDEKGSNVAKEKAIGKKKAFKRMAEIIKDDIVDPEKQVIYLMHADCNLNDIEDFKKVILELVPVKEIAVEILGPVIGASSGPGTIIVNYIGKQ